MADDDPILAELRGGGTAVAEDDDPILKELRGDEEKKAKDRDYPVAPLKGTTTGMFPSPESRNAIPEGPGLPLPPPDKGVMPSPTAVRGPFGEPELPQFMQDENKAAVDAQHKAEDEKAAETSEHLEHPIRDAFIGKDTAAGALAPLLALGRFGSRPLPGQLKAATQKPIINMQPSIDAINQIPAGTTLPGPIGMMAGMSGSAAPSITKGLLKAGEGFLTPQSVALIGGLEGVGGAVGAIAKQSSKLYQAAEAAMDAGEWDKAADAIAHANRITYGNNALRAVNTAVGYKFTYGFLKDTYENSKEFKQALDDHDQDKAMEVLAELVPNAAFAFAGMKDIYERGAGVIDEAKSRANKRADARAESGLQGRVQAKVVPESEVPEDLKNATPAPTEEAAPEETSTVPEEPESTAPEEKPEPVKSKAKAKVPEPEPLPEEPPDRRETAGTSPTGEERRGLKDRLADVQGPPSRAVLDTINETLKEPDLTDYERETLEARRDSLEEHPEDVDALKDVDLGRVREEGKKPIDVRIAGVPSSMSDERLGQIVQGLQRPQDQIKPEEKGQEQTALPTESEEAPAAEDKARKNLISKVNTKDWFHVPPVEGESGYAKRGRFLASTYDEAAFYGRPLDETQKASISNPLIGDEESIAKELGVSPTKEGMSEKQMAASDAEFAAAAHAKGYDSIVLMAPKSFTEYQKSGRVPKSIELQDLSPYKPKANGDRVEEELRKPEAIDKGTAKGSTLPVEAEADERPSEPDTRTERAETLGPRDEGSLERIPPEDVRGTSEERGTGSEGDKSRGADLGRHPTGGESGAGLPERTGGDEDAIHVPAERGRPAGPRREPGQLSVGSRAGHDYRITDADAIGAGGIRTKYRDNISAIRTLKAIEQEGRLATPEEQATLVKYVGWGGIASNQLFNQKTQGGTSWKDEHHELKDLLSEDEYRAASASTPNAHYTSPTVVSGIWNALTRMGFRDGKMLEPSAGVGHFLGLMPTDAAAATAKTAIELDPITGRILKQLYQTADARIQGFEKYNGKDNQFDTVVGNVPFGDYKVHDPAYDKYALSIHNYFIAKSLDKLRPGGVAALITSSSTLDAQDPKARKLFAEKADLVGAIRLPNTAFKGNANTEVTTDILFFRKPLEGEARGGQPFAKLEKVDIAKGEPVAINEYFAKHPDMMLGNMERAGSMYRKDEPALVAPTDQDFPAELQKAIEKLPKDILTPREVPASATLEAAVEAIPSHNEVKQFGLKISKNKVFRKIGEELQAEPDYPAKAIPILKDMLGLRDGLRELFKAEGGDRPKREQDELRGRLNRLYDKFVEKRGILHSIQNERAMRHDPDLPLLLSLENFDERSKTAKKADVFFKQTVAPRVPVVSADSPKDAMLVSLSEKGRLDFEHMASITGQSPEELQNDLKSQGLVFHNPDGHWETTDAYLSGNVRKKLAAARDAAERNPEFQDNVKALETVQPEELPPSRISLRLGSSWLPREVLKDFIGHIFGSPEWGRRTEIQHVDSMGLWTVQLPYGASQNANAIMKWGTKRANAGYIIEQALNMREPVVYDPGPDKKSVLNQAETLAAQEKMEALNDELKRWLFQDSEHAVPMAQKYNEQFNSEIERDWDGSHLTLPGSSVGIQLRPHQKNSIWRNVNGGNQLIAHVVGAGKSFVLAGTAMEWRRLGQAKKPLIVVPSNIVRQISEDFRRLYPEANLLSADKASFEGDNRKEFTSRIATGDWDSVIMGHSQFGLLPVSDENYQEFANDQIDAARAMLSEVVAEEGKRGPTVKQIEKDIKRWQEKIEARLKRESKDNTVNFETLGVDGLLVDEAHYFKRLWFPTKMGRVPGVPTGDSDRAMDMYLKSRYISKLNNGKNVVFSTGTPISNTMAEMYVMQKYLDEDNLKAQGMQHFDSWAANFGQKQTKLEVRPEDPSKMRMHTRFSKFVNVPALIRQFRRIADIKTAEDLNLPRPKLVGGKASLDVAQPSENIIDYIAKLGARAEAIRGKRQMEKGGDNMLNITTDGRKAATDFRLIDPNAEDDPGSKINKAVQNIAQIYHDKADSRATQIAMLDMGVPTVAGKKAGRFNLYADIKRKLVARGIPENEIKFIQDAKNDLQKQTMFDQMNTGEIRVLLGSTPLLGVGVNVQKRLYAIHHLDAPLRPSDIEQRNGRILRQGNTNPEVEEHRYVTERTFDSYIWDMLERKATFTAQVMKGDPTVDEMEDVDDFALSAAEVKAIATGNPLIMRKVETDAQIQRLYSLASTHVSQQFDNKARLARIPEEITAVNKTIENFEADEATRDANKTEKFSMVVGKSSLTERKEAGIAINEAIRKNLGGNEKKIGKIDGMDVYALGTGYQGVVRGLGSHYFSMNDESPMGTIQSLEATLRNIEDKISERNDRLTALKKEQEQRLAESNKPYPKQAELDKLKRQKAEIDAQLDVANRGAGEATTAEEDAPEKKSGEAGFGSVDLFTLGLPALYRRIMAAWRSTRGAAQAQPPPAEETGEEDAPEVQEAAQRTSGLPEEPPGEERPSKAAKPGEKAINIRLDKLNSPEEVIDLIRQTAKTNVGRIQFQRRGRLTDAQLKERMAQVGLDPDKLSKLPRGKTLNEAEIEVAIGIMQSEGHKIREAQEAVRKSNSSENILRAQELHNRYVAIQAAVSGITAEAGRALRTFRRIHNALDRGDEGPTGYEKVIESLGGRKLAEKEAQKLLEIPEDDKIGYYKFLKDHAKFTTQQKIVYYWMNNILSSPRTIIRKLMGDATMVGLNIPKTFIRAMVDPAVAAIQRRPTEYHARDAISQTAAFFGALPEGLKRAAFILKNGFEQEDAEELDIPSRYELPGGYATNFPTRNLAAATAMFKVMHYQSALAGMAMREALQKGMRGKTAGYYAADLVQNPSEELMSEAMKEAKKLALVEDPDSFLRATLRMRNVAIPESFPVVGGLAPLRFVIPFVNIGWNIGKTAVRYSPLGLGRLAQKQVRATPEASNVIAEGLTGSMILAGLAGAIAGGLLAITGSSPKDAAKRDAFFRAGKQPFSIKIGGHWIAYTGAWAIMSPALSAMAAWNDAYEENKKLPDAKQISQVAATIGAAMADEPLFRGFQTLMEAITDPKGHTAETFAAEAASGFIPAASLLRTTAQAIDPAVRDPRGVYERIKAGLPMLSQSVPQRVDVLGRPETHRGAEGAKAFLPSAVPEAGPLSDVDAEMGRLQELGMRELAPTGKAITVQNTKVPLSRSEEGEYKRLRGTLIEKTLESVFNDPEYKALDDQEKIKETQGVIRQVEDFSREEMIRRLVQRRTGKQQTSELPTEP